MLQDLRNSIFNVIVTTIEFIKSSEVQNFAIRKLVKAGSKDLQTHIEPRSSRFIAVHTIKTNYHKKVVGFPSGSSVDTVHELETPGDTEQLKSSEEP